MRHKKFLLAAGAALAALAVLTPSAIAEPTGAPTFRALAGTGSDTTQDVVNALSEVVQIGGVKQIGSYNASPIGSTITTKATGCAGIPRPSGSGAGVNRLQDSLEGVSFPGCVDFARSSALNPQNFPSNPAGGAGQLSFIPFAVDAVAFAIRDDSPLPNVLSKAELTSIYNCELPTTDVRPLLPQFGSGTRAFFLSQLGFTDSATFTSTRPCIRQVDGSGAPLLENTGTLITDPLNIAPYSVAQYQSQINRTIADVHGRTILGQVDGVAPTLLNTASTTRRDVYNVIPTNREAVAPTSTVFVGPTSLVCQNTATIIALGFAPAPNCGTIAGRTS